jgi:hypothetical protein
MNPVVFFTIPTLLTCSHIASTPLLVGVFYLPLEPATRNLVATVLCVAFALADWLDSGVAAKPACEAARCQSAAVTSDSHAAYGGSTTPHSP